MSGKNGQQVDEDSDAEGSAEGDEDESDLDLAWKMLDIARAIVEKQSVNTMEQVDILSTLADVALERGIFMLLSLFLKFGQYFLLQTHKMVDTIILKVEFLLGSVSYRGF